MMSFPYLAYQAEREKTLAEQREEARIRGELAAALWRSWRAASRRD